MSHLFIDYYVVRVGTEQFMVANHDKKSPNLQIGVEHRIVLNLRLKLSHTLLPDFCLKFPLLSLKYFAASPQAPSYPGPSLFWGLCGRTLLGSASNDTISLG